MFVCGVKETNVKGSGKLIREFVGGMNRLKSAEGMTRAEHNVT